MFSNLKDRQLSTNKFLSMEKDLSTSAKVRGAYLKYDKLFAVISSDRSKFAILSFLAPKILEILQTVLYPSIFV